jgi:predicted ATPase
LKRVEAGLNLARRVAHTNSLAFALNFAAVLYNLRNEFDAARQRAEATIDLNNEHPLPQWLAEARICRGAALVGLGQQEKGIAQLCTGLTDWNEAGCQLFDTQWLGWIAGAHLRASQFDDALTTLDRAIRTAGATGECFYQAELYRLRGIVLSKSGEDAEAASWLQRAVETAHSQQARSLELRAATSLARLWTNQSRCDEAYELLAPVYGWFAEGFDTPDLKDAQSPSRKL